MPLEYGSGGVPDGCSGISAEELLGKMRTVIEAEPLAKIDYVSMVDALTMQPVEKADVSSLNGGH